MSNVSPEWLAAIQRGRIYDIDSKDPENAVPIVPWIHPPLHPDLQRVILKIGRRVSLQRLDRLVPVERRINHLAFVLQGVTARNFGTPKAGPETDKAAAISPPGHVAFGNLNFFTTRPAFGHYFALTKAEIVICEKPLLLPVLRAEPKLLELLLKHFESCTLSDRIGLAYMAFASVEQRLKAFVISWAVHYAVPFYKDGAMWLKMPVPLTRSNRCIVANASSVSTDNCLKKWKDQDVWIRNGDFVSFPVSFFEDTYHWMRSSEEQSEYSYTTTLQEFFEKHPDIGSFNI